MPSRALLALDAATKRAERRRSRTVASGTGRTGSAARFARAQVKPGYGHIAECIQNQIEDEDEDASDATVAVRPACRAALLEFKMALVQNINLDVATAQVRARTLP